MSEERLGSLGSRGLRLQGTPSAEGWGSGRAATGTRGRQPAVGTELHVASGAKGSWASWLLLSCRCADMYLGVRLAVGASDRNTLASLSSQAPAVQVCLLGNGCLAARVDPACGRAREGRGTWQPPGETCGRVLSSSANPASLVGLWSRVRSGACRSAWLPERLGPSHLHDLCTCPHVA